MQSLIVIKLFDDKWSLNKSVLSPGIFQIFGFGFTSEEQKPKMTSNFYLSVLVFDCCVVDTLWHKANFFIYFYVIFF